MKTARDVLADRIEGWAGDSDVYQYADRLMADLDVAGFEIVRSLPFPQAFVLERTEDVSGISGTGVVAEGVVFSDGTVSLRWSSDWPTSVVFHDRGIESVEAVHGHSGKTKIVYC